MGHTIAWVLFGFGVWGLAILLHALQRRFAPDMNRSDSHTHTRRGKKSSMWDLGLGLGDDGEDIDEENERLIAEVKELRQRVEVLEAIVTDKKFQFDQELNRDQN